MEIYSRWDTLITHNIMASAVDSSMEEALESEEQAAREASELTKDAIF